MAAFAIPALPLDEPARQAAVERSGVLERGRRGELQRLVEQVAGHFAVPIAAITVIDRRRQWFAAGVGLDVSETPRDASFCAHALHRPGELLVVTDASQDRRFAGNPLVTGAPWIRFYAGKPLMTRDGYPIGALCIIDDKPRGATSALDALTFHAFEAERLINRWS